MKKFFSLLVFIFIVAILAPSQSVLAAKAIKLNTTKKTLYINDKYTLKVSNAPKKIMWKSSNTKVAKVSNSGVVTAKTKGKATITATIGAGSNNTKLTCTITVKGRLSTNAKNAIVYAPMDEYQELLVTFAKPKDGEYLVAEVNNSNIELEAGSTKKNVTSLYITPLEKGISTITIKIAKDETKSSSSKNEDTTYFDDISAALAERDYLDRFSLSYTTYNPITITVYVGIKDSEWINNKDLDSVYNTATIISNDSILLFPSQEPSFTGISRKSISIPLEERELNKEYNYEGLRYRFVKSNSVEFNVQDLKDLKFIK